MGGHLGVLRSAILRVILLHVVSGEPSDLGEEGYGVRPWGAMVGLGRGGLCNPTDPTEGPYPPIDLPFPPPRVPLLAEDADDVPLPQRQLRPVAGAEIIPGFGRPEAPHGPCGVGGKDGVTLRPTPWLSAPTPHLLVVPTAATPQLRRSQLGRSSPPSSAMRDPNGPIPPPSHEGVPSDPNDSTGDPITTATP